MRPDSRFAMLVERDLRNLVNAEEAFFAEHVSYSASIDDLKFRPSNGVTVTIEEASSGAWRAVATHLQSPHWVCGIFVGGVSRSEGHQQAEPTWWHQ
jgi:hypothetical protein